MTCLVCGYALRIYICVAFLIFQLIPHAIVIAYMYRSLECKHIPKLNNLIFMFGYVAYFYHNKCVNLTELHFPPGFITPAPDRFLWYEDYPTSTPPGTPSRYRWTIRKTLQFKGLMEGWYPKDPPPRKRQLLYKHYKTIGPIGKINLVKRKKHKRYITSFLKEEISNLHYNTTVKMSTPKTRISEINEFIKGKRFAQNRLLKKLAADILLGRDENFPLILEEISKFQRNTTLDSTIYQPKVSEILQTTVRKANIKINLSNYDYITRMNLTNYYKIKNEAAPYDKTSTFSKKDMSNVRKLYFTHDFNEKKTLNGSSTMRSINFYITQDFQQKKTYDSSKVEYVSSTQNFKNKISIDHEHKSKDNTNRISTQIITNSTTPMDRVNGLARPKISYLFPAPNDPNQTGNRSDLIKAIFDKAKKFKPEFWEDDKIEWLFKLLEPKNWNELLTPTSTSNSTNASTINVNNAETWPEWFGESTKSMQNLLKPTNKKRQKVTIQARKLHYYDHHDWWTYAGVQYPAWWNNKTTKGWLEIQELWPTPIMWPFMSPQYGWVRDWVITWLIMDLLWIITAVILVAGALVRIRGPPSIFFYTPFLLVTGFIIIMDVVCAAYFAFTIPNVLNFWDYLYFVGIRNVGQLRDPKRVWFPDYRQIHSHASWLLTGFFLRFVVIWLLNIHLFFKILHIFRCVLAQRIVQRNIIFHPKPCVKRPHLVCEFSEPSCDPCGYMSDFPLSDSLIANVDTSTRCRSKPRPFYFCEASSIPWQQGSPKTLTLPRILDQQSNDIARALSQKESVYPSSSKRIKLNKQNSLFSKVHLEPKSLAGTSEKPTTSSLQESFQCQRICSSPSNPFRALKLGCRTAPTSRCQLTGASLAHEFGSDPMFSPRSTRPLTVPPEPDFRPRSSLKRSPKHGNAK